MMSGFPCWWMESPFQSAMNCFYHRMSDLASTFRQMCASLGRLCEDFSRLTRRRMKVRPGLMTMLASWRRPTSDCRSRFRHVFRPAHENNVCWSRDSFSAGRRSWKRDVSSSIPKKVLEEVIDQVVNHKCSD